MMKLADAAAYFDRTPVLNPDNGIRLFSGQLDPFDDSRRDAGAAYRRVLSVKPGTRLPTNRAVRIFDQVWIVGSKETDGLAGPTRDKYVLQRADQKITVYRLPGFLTSSSVASYWGGVEWFKDSKEIEVDSRLPQQCYVFMQLGAAVQERDVLTYAGAALLVLATHEQPSGYTVATALRLDQSVTGTASITQRIYMPGTGAFASAAPLSVACLQVRWQSLFEYGSQADERYQEGDCSLVLPVGTSITTRDRIDYGGVTWSVVATDTLAGALVAHARRA
jgi:hypothetical protein